MDEKKTIRKIFKIIIKKYILILVVILFKFDNSEIQFNIVTVFY